MSEPFTVNASNYQLMSKLEQVRLAFSERHFACTGEYLKFAYIDGRYRWVKGTGYDTDSLFNTQTEVYDQVANKMRFIPHNIQTPAFFRPIQEFINSGGYVNILQQGYILDPHEGIGGVS